MAAVGPSETLILSECKTKVKRKTAAPALDADVVANQKRRENKSKGGASSGGEVDGELVKKLIEEAADKAIKERLVYKIGGLATDLKWTAIKERLVYKIRGLATDLKW